MGQSVFRSANPERVQLLLAHGRTIGVAAVASFALLAVAFLPAADTLSESLRMARPASYAFNIALPMERALKTPMACRFSSLR